MAAEKQIIKIYKRERTTVEKVLGQYENGKTKIVSLKQWNKKCGLLVGKMSRAGDTFVYDSGIELSFDEMETLADALPTMSKSFLTINYAELGESKDSYGNEYRVVLKRSEYDGLKICRFKKTAAPVDFAPDANDDDDTCDDSEPASTTNTPKSSGECWTECFDKFYINKNDDWKKMGNIIRDFCCEANSVLNLSTPEGIDVIPPTPPPATPIEQKQLEPPVKKRKNYNNTKGGAESKKKKTKVLPTDEETTSEVRKKLECASGVMLAYMRRYKKDCEETFAQFGDAMKKHFPYPYENFLMCGNEMEKTCNILRKREI